MNGFKLFEFSSGKLIACLMSTYENYFNEFFSSVGKKVASDIKENKSHIKFKDNTYNKSLLFRKVNDLDATNSSSDDKVTPDILGI